MNSSSSSTTTTTTTATTTPNSNLSIWSFSYYINLWNKQFTEPDSSEETRRTVLRLTERFGETHPAFRMASYNEAVSFAKSKFKFLIVYIHSSQHPSSNSFCKEVLFTREFKEFIEANYIFWVCDVSTSIGLRMCNLLEVTTFPALSLICCNNVPGLTTSSQPVRLELFQGSQLSTKQSAMTIIRTSASHYEPSLVAAKADHDLREQDRFIRQEQDEAFLQSLREDQEKERIRLEKEEQERLEREREEKEEQDKINFQRELEERKQRKQKLFINEPKQKQPNGVDITKLVIRLHDGSKLQRNFLITDTIEFVMDFIDTHIQEPIENYVLSTHYPKKQLSNLNSTLKDEGLYPDSVLFLSEL
ncbi:hypothetical protein ACTFIU_006356 [Dictyostelium citrinum]